MKLRVLKLRSEKGRRDVLTRVRIITAQPNLQGTRHRAFRLAGIWALVFFAITPPDAES
jgi:hypothetical protein